MGTVSYVEVEDYLEEQPALISLFGENTIRRNPDGTAQIWTGSGWFRCEKSYNELRFLLADRQ